MSKKDAPRSVFALLGHNLQERADRPFLYDGDCCVTYGQFNGLVEKVAAWLASRGIEAGDRVAVHLPNGIEAVTAMFAAARLNAVFVTIHRQWQGRFLDRALAHCGARALFTVAGSGGTVPGKMAAVVYCGTKREGEDAVSFSAIPAGDVATPPVEQPGALAALLFTSGSTGRPKAVMVSNANLVDGAAVVSSYLEHTSEDRLLGLLPFSFDYGLNQLLTMMLGGGSVALLRLALPAEIIKTVRRHRLTGAALVPSLWTGLVRYLRESPADLPSLRYVTNSGGGIPLPVLEESPKVFQGKKLYLMYGTTEAFRSTYLPPEDYAGNMGSIGKAVPGENVMVVNEKGHPCRVGETGELVHRGRLVTGGYWKDPEATARIMVHGPGGRTLYTGDMVRQDGEGFFWFVGRKDGLIKCSSFRISPTEVEEELCRMVPSDEAVAFGVADGELGQVVHAAISVDTEQSIDVVRLMERCRRSMPSYMAPRWIHVWKEEFPRTAHGKTDRSTVVARCLQRSGLGGEGLPSWV